MVPYNGPRWRALEHAASGFVFQSWIVGIAGGLIDLVVLIAGLSSLGSLFAYAPSGAGIGLLVVLIICVVIGLATYGVVMALLAKAETIRIMIAIEGHLDVIERNTGGRPPVAAAAAYPGYAPPAPYPGYAPPPVGYPPAVSVPLPRPTPAAPPQPRP